MKNSSKILGKSVGELEVLTYIQTIYTGPILSGYKHPSVNKEIDIYLPDEHIGFEYAGGYWHSEEFKSSTAHLDKQQAYQERGIQVYFLAAADWTNKRTRPILEARIKYILR